MSGKPRFQLNAQVSVETPILSQNPKSMSLKPVNSHQNLPPNHQAIAQTLARDALRTVWDLAARIVTTATLFGVFESVRIVENFWINILFV